MIGLIGLTKIRREREKYQFILNILYLAKEVNNLKNCSAGIAKKCF